MSVFPKPENEEETMERAIDPSALQCVGCFLEVHAGQRDKANPAALVVGGNSTCLEHVQVGPAPMVPGRTPSGLILGQ